jgi:hypothetical protein
VTACRGGFRVPEVSPADLRPMFGSRFRVRLAGSASFRVPWRVPRAGVHPG